MNYLKTFGAGAGRSPEGGVVIALRRRLPRNAAVQLLAGRTRLGTNHEPYLAAAPTSTAALMTRLANPVQAWHEVASDA